jgi:Dehydrogenases (flavoproteins)
MVDRVRQLPHGILDTVEFIAIGGRKIVVGLPSGEESEIAVKRSLFDALLLGRASELGAHIFEETTVSALSKRANKDGWRIETSDGRIFAAKTLVGADGRNSTVARLCNLLPRPSRERVALQAHITLPADFGDRVVLQFLPEGYSGQAPVNREELNVCLVSNPSNMPALRRWAEKQFSLQQNHQWRTITPLTRAALAPAREELFLVGDAARVVEPFTGEGVYYALRSGELAAQAIVKLMNGKCDVDPVTEYTEAHAAMYRGRLWVNQLSRSAVLAPRFASLFVHLARVQPSILRLLTAKIVRSN